MKRYYVGGQEITEVEAKEIENENREVLRSGTIEELLNIKRIIVKEDWKWRSWSFRQRL